MKTKIRGKIIRIVDNKTVVINLGYKQGITLQSVFGILSEPEPIIDPETGEILGNITILKSKVKATSVSEKFSVASSDLHEFQFGILSDPLATFRVSNDNLNVVDEEIDAWNAIKDNTIHIGDEVEVTVEFDDDSKDETELQEKSEK